MKKVYVYGFPGLYGGAGTELHHQIFVWLKLGLEVHIIPTNAGYKGEPLFKEMTDLGVIIHDFNKFAEIEKDAPVFGFCNAEFLNFLPEICKYSKRTCFVGCMTWTFTKQQQRHKDGLLWAELFQNESVRLKHMEQLSKLDKTPVEYITFCPYFEASKFPFIENRDSKFFNIGHISRQDADKFTANTQHIYEYITAPVEKRGWFLGFDERSEKKIGKLFWWQKAFKDQNQGFTQQDFYRTVDVIVQPTETTENWPRIGLEAMSSGVILVVDNRGGWQQMVKHGETGFLCKTQQEFIYYASRLAFEPDTRKKMALAARQRCLDLSSMDVSMKSWQNVFTQITK